MTEGTEIIAVPPAAAEPADENVVFGKAEMESIFKLLTDEAKRRLTKASYIRSLDTNELLNHIEKIIALNKKNPIIAPMTINNNLGIIQSRVKELDVHPARRKELRQEFRDRKIPRNAR